MEKLLQPTLENSEVKLLPLQDGDFERLYKVASDPEIWAQHPNKNRWEKEPFRNFFEGAMMSGGAFLILDKESGEVAGSTRFYDYREEERSVFIGYSFYGTKFWGSRLNPQAKKLMLDYIFQYVDLVKFHVGAENRRSRKAMERLGAELKGEIIVAYHGEPDRNNVEYWITKKAWITQNTTQSVVHHQQTMNSEINFRKATPEDAGQIWQILQQAIRRRKNDGSRQWQDGYPNPETVERDIAHGIGYVLTENNAVVAYAAVIYNDEPAYEAIEGKWLSDADFNVIHRVAVSDEAAGKGFATEIFRRIEEYSRQNGVFSIKVDTNFDNKAMLRILEKLGYTYCGEVYFRGSARRAFEKILR